VSGGEPPRRAVAESALAESLTIPTGSHTMFSRIARQALRSARSFTTSAVKLAAEDPQAARMQRLAAFQEQIRNSPNIHQQLKSIQLVIASKMEVTNEPPSLMQQIKLLSDAEVRAEMVKLSDIMKEENVNLNKEDVGFLMQALKAQMDKEDK
jgi:succinate dehydrogenase/fumarate reductase flavoprotein subunit